MQLISNMFPCRKVPTEERQIRFLNDPLSFSSFGVGETARPIPGHMYTWPEMMSIVSILLTGEKRVILRRAAMAIIRDQKSLFQKLNFQKGNPSETINLQVGETKCKTSDN